MQELFSALSLWLSAHPLITGWYTAIARLLFPVLSALILVRAIRSLLRIPHTPEVWAQLSLPGGGSIPLTHWENILGRGKSADAILNYPSISRQHAALCRGEDGAWTVYDLGSKGGTAVNGTPVTEQAPVKLGDTITLGGVPLVFLPQTVGEREELEKKRQAERPAAMWPSFLWLTVFQILTAIQLTLAAGEKASPVIPICFLILTAVMWLYAAALRLGRCVGFDSVFLALWHGQIQPVIIGLIPCGDSFQRTGEPSQAAFGHRSGHGPVFGAGAIPAGSGTGGKAPLAHGCRGHRPVGDYAGAGQG